MVEDFPQKLSNCLPMFGCDNIAKLQIVLHNAIELNNSNSNVAHHPRITRAMSELHYRQPKQEQEVYQF